VAFTLRGQYHHGCAAAAVVAGLLGLLVAVAFTAQVCLNKALPPLHPADLPSSPSPSPLLPQPGDLLVIDSTSSLLLSAKSSTRRLFYCRLRLTPGNSLPGCWLHDLLWGSDCELRLLPPAMASNLSFGRLE
jgi:hypothetical protein